jgi:hypothetical protein
MRRWRQAILSIPMGAALSWMMILAMAWIVPVELLKGNYPLALMAGIATLVSLLPAALRRSFHIVLPWELELLVVLQIYLHAFWGAWLEMYRVLPFWDKSLHLQGTLLVSLMGFLCVYALHLSGRLRLSGPFIALFTVVFGNALGVWWEILEFATDQILSQTTQSGLNDTMWDLIYNLGGSLLAAGMGWLYIRHTNPQERRRMAKPLAELVGSWLHARRRRRRRARTTDIAEQPAARSKS